jgi:hypothetical protein
MPSFFETAISAGLTALRGIAGSPVTYTQGATTLTISNAVQGATMKLPIDVGGAEQVVEISDWLIRVSDLAGLTPASGDIIVRVIDGTTYTWSVETRELGETEWDWSDTARTTYRIRARKDGASAYEVSEPTGFDLAGNELRTS